MSEQEQAEACKAQVEQMLEKLRTDEGFRTQIASDPEGALKSIGFSDGLIEHVNRGSADVEAYDFELPCRGIYVPFPSCYWTNACFRTVFWYWY